uniref:Uncharacterized protein n=1 Tax=Cannabis sativa TaxID=3483 RepID=A0A803R1R4_CANSA
MMFHPSKLKAGLLLVKETTTRHLGTQLNTYASIGKSQPSASIVVFATFRIITTKNVKVRCHYFHSL